MYAMLRRHDGAPGSTEDLIREGRRLAGILSRESGFVAHVILEAREGGFASISIFDDAATLANAVGLIERWTETNLLDRLGGPVHVTIGEVVVQRGL